MTPSPLKGKKKIKDDLQSTLYKKILEKVALSCQGDNVYTTWSQTSPDSEFGGTLKAEKRWSKPQALSDIY